MTKIAIVEDNQSISLMYRLKFEAEGFEVALADNGKKGVELVAQYQPDLLLLDLQMPEMNGDEALGEIRATEEGRTLPVIILTNTGEEEAPPALKNLAVSSYIVKADFTPSKVVAKVKETLGL